MSNIDWDRELARIDRQIASLSSDELQAADKAPPSQRETVPTLTRWSVYGAIARLGLALVLGVAILFWPYGARCGWGLLGYLVAVVILVGAGVWSAFWSWRHRTPRAHILSLLVILWGLILGSMEILPRTGYAIPTPGTPAIWRCP